MSFSSQFNHAIARVLSLPSNQVRVVYTPFDMSTHIIITYPDIPDKYDDIPLPPDAATLSEIRTYLEIHYPEYFV